jgi:hypothetical protein
MTSLPSQRHPAARLAGQRRLASLQSAEMASFLAAIDSRSHAGSNPASAIDWSGSNDDFEGGATAFHESRDSLLVMPEVGRALVFYHRQLHEGMPVVRGRKYVLRTDIMFRYDAAAR